MVPDRILKLGLGAVQMDAQKDTWLYKTRDALTVKYGTHQSHQLFLKSIYLLKNQSRKYAPYKFL
jgi:hypothetical protein